MNQVNKKERKERIPSRFLAPRAGSLGGLVAVEQCRHHVFSFF